VTKVLIKHPRTGRTVLDHVIDAFSGKRVIVVVGYRAIQIMESYPQLDYVVNFDWAITHNAMSLGLALNDEPTYVVSGDMFFQRPLIDELDRAGANIVVTQTRESRTLNAMNCVLRDDASVAEIYVGPLRDVTHPEAIGLFKIGDPALLRRWKQHCIQHGNLFVGQTLPCDGAPVMAMPLGRHAFDEINTPVDYLRLIERCRSE
jgi:choline kinase